jgi:Fe2+ or Zn2+ uptake regulation protein
MASQVDDILRSVRSSGGRATVARRVILEALVSAPNHLTADELAERVQAKAPEVHTATVYRNLDALKELGIVYQVHLGVRSSYWHLSNDAHQHLVCDACGLVRHVQVAAFDDVATVLATGFDFHADVRHFVVVGRCGSCVGHA